MYPVGKELEGYYPPQNPTEITDFKVGDTIMHGVNVVNENKIRKVPTLYHPEYLTDYIKDERFLDLIDLIFTGTVKTPIAKITSGSISRNGTAQGFTGPGILTVQEGKLMVSPPAYFIWGYKTPYVFAFKTKDGIEIREQNKTLSFVAYDQINNETVPHEYLSIKRLKRWYNKADIGDKIALDYAISAFSDGRNLVEPEKIKFFFGDEVKNYMINYPSASPVRVYDSSKTEKVIGSGGDVLGSYPQYNDAARIYNAMQFVRAWNGTIIPPRATSSGKQTVGFDSSTDPKAPGGAATHGVCPPARALRAACSDAGFPLPKGMSWEYYAVMYGYSPSTGITVTNTGDYPIKIIMWSEGRGTGMRIYAKIVELRPS